jgi:hypothetical protein
VTVNKPGDVSGVARTETLPAESGIEICAMQQSCRYGWIPQRLSYQTNIPCFHFALKLHMHVQTWLLFVHITLAAFHSFLVRSYVPRPTTTAARFKEQNVLARSNTGIVWVRSHSRHWDTDVGSGLATGLIPHPRYPTDWDGNTL